MENLIFVRAKDLLQLGFTNQNTANWNYTRIRRKYGRRPITYLEVAEYLSLPADFVLKRLNKR